MQVAVDSSIARTGKPTRGSGTIPFSRETLRKELFDLAGVTKERQAELLRVAIEQLELELVAMKTEFFTYKGDIKSEKNLVDHTARLAAIQKAFDFVDACRSKTEGESTPPVKFVINFPDWHKPAIDVECKVVDAGNSEGKQLPVPTEGLSTERAILVPEAKK